MNPFQPQLDERLSAMPLEVAPPSDLWPKIAAGVRHQPHRLWLMNAAACLAVASLVFLMARAAFRDGSGTIQTPLHTAGAMTSVNFSLPDSARYQDARSAMEATFYERLKLLRPETRTTITTNLQIIKKANDDIRHALESDPASPLLLQLLNETYQQEFDLYQNVARNTEPTQGRS
jgi:hypothetical protein